ncbi:MAG: amidohydrolase family protein [Bacteroidota bacterium]
MRSYIHYWMLLLLIAACQPKPVETTSVSTANPATGTNPASYAITNVNLLPMTSETVIPGQTVIVRDGKIHKILDEKTLRLSPNTKVIDGTGKYLMPGLAEMHAHIPVAQNGDETYVKETLFLYLANGITTIRGMLGDPYHLELKQKVANGSIASPRIFTSSPSLNGNTIPTPEEAKAKVTQYQKDGYDFLKIHPGIPLDAFNAMAQTAEEVGIRFAGHVPIDVGIRRAIAAGYETIDHADGYLEGLVPEKAVDDPTANGFFGYNFAKIADPAGIPDLCKATKAAGIYVVPTQSLMVRVTSKRSPEEILNDPEMKYLPAKTRYQWRHQGRQWLMGNSEMGEGYADKFIAIRKQLLKTMQEQGVDLLLGSDSPQIFNVPGFSIQHELQSLVDAGLTPYKAMATGCVNVGKFYAAEEPFGTLVEGAAADMILLEANPLEDISHLMRKTGVFYRGQYLAKADIEKELAAIEARHSE